MQHYFTTGQLQIGDVIKLTGEIHHRLSRVRRSERDEVIELVDETPKAFLAKITDITATNTTVKIMQTSTMTAELPLLVTIVAGYAKGDKTETLIKRGTEFGATKFVFFNADYSIARLKSDRINKKIMRLEKIAQEAAEQSRRWVIPKIELIDKLESYDFSMYDERIIAYEETAKAGETSSLRQILASITAGKKIVSVFGPEGGISPREVDLLQSQDFQKAALGRRILRAESAPLYLLSVLSYETEMK